MTQMASRNRCEEFKRPEGIVADSRPSSCGWIPQRLPSPSSEEQPAAHETDSVRISRFPRLEILGGNESHEDGNVRAEHHAVGKTAVHQPFDGLQALVQSGSRPVRRWAGLRRRSAAQTIHPDVVPAPGKSTEVFPIGGVVAVAKTNHRRAN